MMLTFIVASGGPSTGRSLSLMSGGAPGSTRERARGGTCLTMKYKPIDLRSD